MICRHVGKTTLRQRDERRGTLHPVNETPARRTRLADAIAEGPSAVGRSHRLHRPRGGFCGRGYCQQCPLAGNDGLACEVPSNASAPRPRTDLIRPLGWIGESMEPWFYERRFLRPRFARQAVLEVLRRLSAAHVLGDRTEWNATEPRALETDVLVVGGGPAGLAAGAITAAAGVRTLV